jgi:hypothetical protein
MNRISRGQFFSDATLRGLETYTVTEIRKLAHSLTSPAFMNALRESVILHRDFYLAYYRGWAVKSLLDVPAAQDISVHNIAAMCRWLGIPPTRGGRSR